MIETLQDVLNAAREDGTERALELDEAAYDEARRRAACSEAGRL